MCSSLSAPATDRAPGNVLRNSTVPPFAVRPALKRALRLSSPPHWIPCFAHCRVINSRAQRRQRCMARSSRASITKPRKPIPPNQPRPHRMYCTSFHSPSKTVMTNGQGRHLRGDTLAGNARPVRRLLRHYRSTGFAWKSAAASSSL